MMCLTMIVQQFCAVFVFTFYFLNYRCFCVWYGDFIYICLLLYLPMNNILSFRYPCTHTCTDEGIAVDGEIHEKQRFIFCLGLVLAGLWVNLSLVITYCNIRAFYEFDFLVDSYEICLAI